MSSKGMVSVAIVFITMGAVLFLATPAARAGAPYWQIGNGCWDTDSDWGNDSQWQRCSCHRCPTTTPTSMPTAAAVTISNTVGAGNVTFTGSGYTVTGGSLNLGGGTITTTQDATIGSAIGGVVGLTKAGAGVLTLGGSNAYSGGTSLTAGTLRFGTSASVTPIVRYALSGTGCADRRHDYQPRQLGKLGERNDEWHRKLHFRSSRPGLQPAEPVDRGHPHRQPSSWTMSTSVILP